MGIIIRNGKQYGFSGKVGTASSVLYDNTNSQIEVATVQEAIDYILENGVSGGGLLEVDLTKVEYEEMVAQDVIVDNVTYYITDDDDEYNASTIVYDNTDTGLESGNVQGAITEINAKVNEQNKNIVALWSGESLGESIAIDDFSNYNFDALLVKEKGSTTYSLCIKQTSGNYSGGNIRVNGSGVMVTIGHRIAVTGNVLNITSKSTFEADNLTIVDILGIKKLIRV